MMNVGPCKTALQALVIISGHPKAVLSLQFYLLYVWCCSVVYDFI